MGWKRDGFDEFREGLKMIKVCPMSKYPEESDDWNGYRIECVYCGHFCFVSSFDVAFEEFASSQGSWFCDENCFKLAHRRLKIKKELPITRKKVVK